MVAPRELFLGNTNSIRTTQNVVLMKTLYNKRVYNPRRDREQHIAEWQAGIEEACLVLPTVLAVLTGEIILKPFNENLKDVMAQGVDLEKATEICTNADREYKDLNLLGFVLVKSSIDLTSLFEKLDSKTIKDSFTHGAERDGHGLYQWVLEHATVKITRISSAFAAA